MADLKDSGTKRTFESGAHRDSSEGKGRADLLPLDIVGDILESRPLIYIEKFKETKDITCLKAAITSFCEEIDMDLYTAMIEASMQYEDGAKKYGENNWKNGFPLHSLLDSASRHYLEHHRGDRDEPHYRAFLWNLLGACWTYKHKPELDDVELDVRKEK